MQIWGPRSLLKGGWSTRTIYVNRPHKILTYPFVSFCNLSRLQKYFLIFILTTIKTDATLKLNDNYIPIEGNDIVIWENYGYLQHATNMTTYEDYADQTEAMTKTFTDDHRTPVIATDLRHIRKLVTTLKFYHRATRSINLIGTALKIIAGTTDFND